MVLLILFFWPNALSALPVEKEALRPLVTSGLREGKERLEDGLDKIYGFLSLQKNGLKTEGIMAIDIKWLTNGDFYKSMKIKLAMLTKLREKGKFDGEIWLVYDREKELSSDMTIKRALALVTDYQNIVKISSRDKYTSAKNGIFEFRHYKNPNGDVFLEVFKYKEGGTAKIKITKGTWVDAFALFRMYIAMQNNFFSDIDRNSSSRLIRDLVMDNSEIKSVLEIIKDSKVQDAIISSI